MVRAAVAGLVACALAFGVGAWLACRDANGARDAMAEQYRVQKQLNDSTAVLLAGEQAKRRELEGLVVAEHELHGKLAAGVKLRIARRDTLVIHDTLPTTLSADSTRTAQFKDSTFAGVIQGTVTAPPCCSALGVRYALTRPAFAPEVGFIKVGSRFVATVVWQGERVQIDNPFVDPSVFKGSRTSKYVSALYNPSSRAWTASGAVEYQLWGGVSAHGELTRTLAPGQSVQLNGGLVRYW